VEIRISKFLSGLLRHFGPKFGIELDGDGWAELEKVERVVRERYGVGRDVIQRIVEKDAKGRFELANGRIRAKYGHSVAVNTRWSESSEIPPRLYHGTRPEAVNSILERGLLPMKRLEVHLSESVKEAIEVGRRHCKNPAVLEIDAKGMLRRGYEIRKKGKVYTADFVPAEFIRVKNDLNDDFEQNKGKKLNQLNY